MEQYELGPYILYSASAEDTIFHCVMARDEPNGGRSLYYFYNDEYHTSIKDSTTFQPEQFNLLAYPNPFNSSINFNVSGLKGGKAEISIYNLTGELVKTLAAKEGKTIWDARDNSGKEVSSGVYFARVETVNYTTIKKLLFLK